MTVQDTVKTWRNSWRSWWGGTSPPASRVRTLGPEELLEKWDARWLHTACMFAQWSKDPTTKCGAVIVRPGGDRSMASHGYNGFPRGASDDALLYADRETKLSRTIHAELNAILNSREVLEGYTLYVWPMPTCDRCAAHILQKRIKRVVCVEAPPDQAERWAVSLAEARRLYDEADYPIEVIHVPLDSVRMAWSAYGMDEPSVVSKSALQAREKAALVAEASSCCPPFSGTLPEERVFLENARAPQGIDPSDLHAEQEERERFLESAGDKPQTPFFPK